MLTFLLHRIWQSLVLLLLVSIIGFAILNLAPGGPCRNLLSRRA